MFIFLKFLIKKIFKKILKENLFIYILIIKCLVIIMDNRIIVLIDMDCFYAQIEQRLRPELYGTPVAVSQVTGTSNPGL